MQNQRFSLSSGHVKPAEPNARKHYHSECFMNLKAALCTASLAFTLVTASFAQGPQFGHVYIVVEENHGYSSVIGNTALPYLNSLANQYGLATNYFANTHPSIGNYFMLTTGEIVSNIDSYAGTVTVDNIVRELVKAGKTWKCYAESLPSVGYTGHDVYPYVKHHNPFAYFSDVTSSTVEQKNLVPFSQFADDLVAGHLPQYSFIVPNVQNDAHDCPAGMTTCTDTDKLMNADHWLQTHIDPLVTSPTLQLDGLLIILFDESVITNTTNGGGHVAAVVVSPKVKSPGYRGSGFYQHESVLRLMAAGLGLTAFPGSSALVPDMAQFFGAAIWPCPVANNGARNAVLVCMPSDGSTLTSPVGVFAVEAMHNPVVSIQLQADGHVRYQANSERLSVGISLPVGSHRLTVQATDNAGLTVSSVVSVKVVAP
jgi:phosphatidylinositol-3-phosphatase